ncbi:MAG: carbonic anhydrase [Chthonomonadaceae bacterium]|nr:carbonic anhydrase [Chthonomonadaceae bacterium]
MDTIWTGAARFNKTESHLLRHLMAKLTRDGQKPQALFITCADSRIVPSTITGTGPGDLFTMRNIGNLVPAYDNCPGGATTPVDREPSMGAALAYAVEALQTPSIIVCGHSECGAMKAVASGDMSRADPHLQVWLTHAMEAARKLDAGYAPDPTLPRHDQLAQINAVQQAANLSEYPVVARALREGRVQIHSWYFDMAQAEVQVYDPQQHRFVRLDEAALPEKETPSVVASPKPDGHVLRRQDIHLEQGGRQRETERSTLHFSRNTKGEDRCA